MTSLVLGAFAVMFLIILINLSGNLKTLLDITRICQENFGSSDGGTGDEAGTTSVKEIGGYLFRGKIPEMGASEKIQKKIPDSEAKPPSNRISSEKIVTDKSQISPDRRPTIKEQEVSPSVTDRPESYVFCVHYASYKDLTDAKREVARLSDRGLPANWVKTDVPSKGQWFRVYIGKEKTRQGAMDLAVKLKGAGMIREIYVKRVKVE